MVLSICQLNLLAFLLVSFPLFLFFLFLCFTLHTQTHTLSLLLCIIQALWLALTRQVFFSLSVMGCALSCLLIAICFKDPPSYLGEIIIPAVNGMMTFSYTLAITLVYIAVPENSRCQPEGRFVYRTANSSLSHTLTEAETQRHRLGERMYVNRVRK